MDCVSEEPLSHSNLSTVMAFHTQFYAVVLAFQMMSRPKPFAVAWFLKRFCAQHLCLKGTTFAAPLETLFYTVLVSAFSASSLAEKG